MIEFLACAEIFWVPMHGHDDNKLLLILVEVVTVLNSTVTSFVNLFQQ
jgi:hypothetical protein